jgi:hypothetical protein
MLTSAGHRQALGLGRRSRRRRRRWTGGTGAPGAGRLRISSKMVCRATVSAATGTPDRPSRVATGPAGGHALAQPQRPAGAARRCSRRWLAYCSARCSTWVLASGTSACESRRSRPRSAGHLGQHLALQAAGQRAQREHAATRSLRARNLSISTRPGSSSTGSVSGGQTRLVTPPGRGRGQLALEHAFVLVAGLAQARRQVHQTGRHDQPARRSPVGAWKSAGTGPMATMRPPAIATSARCSSRPLAGSTTRPFWIRILHALSLPAMMDITAMRTAMPKVTCGRITLCGCRRPRRSRSRRRG